MATIPKKEVNISRGPFAARPVRTAASRGQSSPPLPKRLGDLLVNRGAITTEQLEQAVSYQQTHACFLGKALVELEFIQEADLVAFLAKQTNIPHLNLANYHIQREVLDMLPLEFCRQRHVVAIDKLGSMLTVAMVNPLDAATLDDIRARYPNLRIKPMLCGLQHLEKVLDRRTPLQGDYNLLGITNGDEPADLTPVFVIDPATEDAGPPAPSGPPAVSDDRGKSGEFEAPWTNQSTEERASNGAKKSRSISPIAMALDPTADLSDSWLTAFFGEEEVDGQAPESTGTVATTSDISDDVPEQIVRHQPNAGQGEPAATPAAPATVADASATSREIEAPEEPAVPAPPAALADIVRDSIRDAVGMVAQAIRQRDQDNPASAQELSTSLRGAVYAAVKGIGSRVASEDALDAVGNDFPEIQAATQQALRDAEAVVVNEARLHELEAAHRRKHIPFALPRYDSVHSFGNPAQGCLAQETDDIVMSALESERPLQEYRFDDYFVDKSNAFTFSLCRAVAEKPGRDYNPFFLYGSVGVGKTHLINAIGNFIQNRDESSRVGYVSAIFFASRLSDAIHDGALKAFRDNYCHWDVLILDDMQFLGGRIDAQEEFFHIFNALHQAGRQIIIAGDQAPDRLGLLEERLVSRFSGGIVAHLRPPSYETRMDILRHHVRIRDVAVPDDVLSFLAEHVTNDVRKLTGSLRKLLAFADLVGQDITLEMATQILGHLGVAEAV